MSLIYTKGHLYRLREGECGDCSDSRLMLLAERLGVTVSVTVPEHTVH